LRAEIGPNGAGKSSLLNIIDGVYRANAGEIVFDGARFERTHPLKRWADGQLAKDPVEARRPDRFDIA
jgi:ABC-type branched-subunit amino acid transport system ATPase component